ncbi:DUF5681 domain-containing protein [Solidesulfovibrio carbinolicus]|uniref:DUF5681 domain-containing protein n=1 Tax=Solidesulfovibrio carbinolicus TaxID=296842 RepID=A0A4P6HZH1_9BACT|nr:DUF5681 domain-containing protein [Solidesulfovibrio carbinolicus]QAZ66799.1 hypothetical protein C3Y92_05885 [Solidesulfovibrio carbinolicus]
MSDKADQKQKRLPSTAWKPGQSGNPKGCRTGSRHNATLTAQTLLDGEAEALTRKAVGLALVGDMTALRLCLERVVPPRKDSPVKLTLPAIGSAVDIPAVTCALLAAVAQGDLTPSEAQAVDGLVETHRRALETSELAERIARIEDATGL